MTLADVLGAVAGQVSYLRASPDADGPDWVRCDALVTDAVLLAEVVEKAKPGLGTDVPAVAASLFVQAYAFRVAGVALAAYAMGLPVPAVAPERTAVRLDKPRPSAVAYLDPGVAPGDAAALADALVRGHLAPFVDAVHDRFSVGARLLWGNVASSCATAFRAVEGASADVEKAAIRDRAEVFMAAGVAWFNGLGAFTTVRVGTNEGWYWDRTNCCLWYRTERGQLCDNCSLATASDLHTQRVRELSESAP